MMIPDSVIMTKSQRSRAGFFLFCTLNPKWPTAVLNKPCLLESDVGTVLLDSAES